LSLDRLGAIVVPPLRTIWSRNARGRRGSGVVWWLTVTVVGFLAATGLVIVLGRGATAPWERKRRVVHTRRRTVVARTQPSTRAFVRLRDAVARKAAAVLPGTGPSRKPPSRRGSVWRRRPLRLIRRRGRTADAQVARRR